MNRVKQINVKLCEDWITSGSASIAESVDALESSRPEITYMLEKEEPPYKAQNAAQSEKQ